MRSRLVYICYICSLSLFAITMTSGTRPLPPVPASTQSPNNNPQTVADIDTCIQLLEQKRQIYQTRQAFASSNASRILTEDFLQYRRYMQESQRYSELIQDIDTEIAKLQMQKQKLLQKQGQ